LGGLATALAGARLFYPVSGAPSPQTSQEIPRPKRQTQRPRIEFIATAAPPTDRLFARLSVAATASERCSLLEQVQPSEDAQATYAIAAVLERAQLNSVRACATQALVRQPTVEARSWLVDLAEDPEPEVHASALEGLAARDDASRLLVVEATHSEDLELRVSAVKALLEANREEGYSAAVAVLPLIEDAATLASLIEALGDSHDPRALQALESLLENADRENHLQAISALGELGVASAAQRLVAFLELGSNEEFTSAADALKKLDPELALTRLRAVFASASGERQELALSAMTSFDGPDIATIMRQELESGEPGRARIALHWLINAPDPSFEAALVVVAEGDDWHGRMLAMQALSKLSSPSAQAALQRLTGTMPESFEERFAAPTPENLAHVRERRIARLSRDDLQPGTLIALARDPDESAQEAVLQYLSRNELSSGLWAQVVQFVPTSTLERIVERNSRASGDAKEGVIQGLGRRGDPKFAATLRDELRGDLRNSALTALAQLGDESVVPELVQLGKNDDSSDRALAVQLLSARTDREATQELERLASDSDTQVMSDALHALQARSPELVARLAARAIREAEPEERASVLSSLSDLKPTLTRPLLEAALSDADDSIAVQAIQALGNLRGPASAQRLLAVASDSTRSEEVRREAASSLRTLGGPLVHANSTLLDALLEPETEEFFVCHAN